MHQDPYRWLDKSLQTIHRANWYRSVKKIQSLPGAVVDLEGHPVINFASNDYLGLAGDERLIQAAIAATEKFGTGSTGSRLLSGHRPLHVQLEKAIATLKQTEAALVFSSGYLANLGTITALVGKQDLILSDQYNHSSLKNGALLSGATVIDYTHNNISELETVLHQHRHSYRRCLIITDSVFSMDGDLCPLPEILTIAEQFECMVVVDEAHGTGVLGATGAGCVEYFQCTGKPLIQIGTLSKALGSLGGYVAGSATLIDFLRNRSPGWIYTTALSPADTAAALAALEIIQIEPQRRDWLWQNVNFLKQQLALQAPHFAFITSQSPILCITLKNASSALTMAQKLQHEGIFAPAIRPPTVPTSRLRLSIMATHQPEHLQKLVDCLVTSDN